ncbi:lipid A deacylase LpxR family protein [Fodinicurvata halophila]|uniref:Lipid A deacylase LpxR family protein n=1 Tax=Fodinicurvata halophila TaxID=1419723 RepID=A0ABV8UL07_9PROT
MRKRMVTALIAGFTVFTFFPPVLGQDDRTAEEEQENRETGTFTLQLENDRAAGTDRDYTNGFRFEYLSAEKQGSHWARSLIEAIPLLNYGDRLRYSVAFGQSIFTPRDTQESDVIKGDRPYAGWLYGSLGAIAYDEDYGLFQTVALDVGMIGPAALGRQVQNTTHRILDIPTAKGWDHQLNNEPGFILSYERKWREFHYKPDPEGRFGIDMMPHVGISLGNVMTYGAAGASMRVGFDLADDFGPPRIRPSLPGSSYFKLNDRLSGYLFAGIEGRGVARDIFLDGNTFTDSHSVDRRWFHAEAQGGLALSYGPVRLTYTQVWRSAQIRDRDVWDSFGSVALSVRVPF